jgi:hypothetical protein
MEPTPKVPWSTLLCEGPEEIGTSKAGAKTARPATAEPNPRRDRYLPGTGGIGGHSAGARDQKHRPIHADTVSAARPKLEDRFEVTGAIPKADLVDNTSNAGLIAGRQTHVVYAGQGNRDDCRRPCAVDVCVPGRRGHSRLR